MEERAKPKLVSIKFLGSEKNVRYSGMDPVTGSLVRCEKGTMITVSEAKAEQLRKDFPGQWGDEDDEVASPEPTPEPEEENEDDAEPVEEDEEEEDEKPQKSGKKVVKKKKRK